MITQTALAYPVVVNLDGITIPTQQQPTVGSADADFNNLGIQMRGYHDFGCVLQEPCATRVEIVSLAWYRGEVVAA